MWILVAHNIIYLSLEYLIEMIGKTFKVQMFLKSAKKEEYVDTWSST